MSDVCWNAKTWFERSIFLHVYVPILLNETNPICNSLLDVLMHLHQIWRENKFNPRQMKNLKAFHNMAIYRQVDTSL